MYPSQPLWSPEALTAPQLKASHSHVGFDLVDGAEGFNVGHLYRRPCHKAELSTEQVSFLMSGRTNEVGNPTNELFSGMHQSQTQTYLETNTVILKK